MNLIKRDQEINMGKFVMLPKEVLSLLPMKEIKANDVIVYTLLLDRLSLSMMNADDFSDSEGNVYVVYEQRELQELTGLSNKSVATCIKRLEKAGLIEVKRQGRMLPNLYFFADLSDGKNKWNVKITPMKCKNYTHEVKKVHTSNTNTSHTENNQTNNKRYIALTSDGYGAHTWFMSAYNDRYKRHKQKEHPLVLASQLSDLHDTVDTLYVDYGLTKDELLDIVDYHFDYLPSHNDGKVQYLLQGTKHQSVVHRYIQELQLDL